MWCSVSQYFTMFSGQGPCGARVITYLICHVTLCWQSCMTICGSLLYHLSKLSSLMAIGLVIVKICLVVVKIQIFNLSSDLTKLHDQETLWLYGRKLFIVRNQPLKFGGHSYCGGGDIAYLIFRWPRKTMWLKDLVTLLNKVQCM